MHLDQNDIHEYFRNLEQGGWSIVSDDWWRSDSHGGVFCAFCPMGLRDQLLDDPRWEVRKESPSPHFFRIVDDDDNWITRYDSGIDRSGAQPLVLVREFHGVIPNSLEIEQEFRLFHNIYWDELTRQYYKPLDDGTSIVAVKFDGECVRIRTKLLRQYMAARQLELLLYIDSLRFGKGDQALPDEWSSITSAENIALEVSVISRYKTFSRFVGTRIISPPEVQRSEIWPYEVPDDYFPEFICAVDEDGEEVRHSCNPHALKKEANTPDYLTPVHFRKDVLQKYYDRPELYTVSDGRLSCASLWSIQIDNSAESSVVVFLGDLGRDLPRQERDYWSTFNIAPDSYPSNAMFRRSFLAQIAEPDSVDLQVRHKYIELADKWGAHFAWPLYRRPTEVDAGLLQRLRIPLNEYQAEFEASIRIMTQLFVDAINESALSGELPTKVENEKGIAKLERWLNYAGYPNTVRDIKFLRDLQDVRSTATAHRKSSNYEERITRIVGNNRGSRAVSALLDRALTMLSGLTDWVENRSLNGSPDN